MFPDFTNLFSSHNLQKKTDTQEKEGALILPSCCPQMALLSIHIHLVRTTKPDNLWSWVCVFFYIYIIKYAPSPGSDSTYYNVSSYSYLFMGRGCRVYLCSRRRTLHSLYNVYPSIGIS